MPPRTNKIPRRQSKKKPFGERSSSFAHFCWRKTITFATLLSTSQSSKGQAMEMEQWKGMRATWTTARNSHKVGQGAVKGVNLGEAIDAIAKATPKGLLAVNAAAEALLKSIEKYKASIKKT